MLSNTLWLGRFFTLLMVVLSFATSRDTLLTMSPNSWLKVPNSRMQDVAINCSQYTYVCSFGTPGGVMAYSGAMMDTRRNRFVLFGGGHNNYAGNEIYAYDIDSMKWVRVTNPTDNPSPIGADVLYDSTPGSRHTYNGLIYDAREDKLFTTGGSIFSSGNAACASVWYFDFAANRWLRRDRTSFQGTAPSVGYECNAAYDSTTGKVWWGDDGMYVRSGGPGLFSYDYGTNTWTKHTSDQLAYTGSAIDTKRGILVIAGGGKVWAYNIRSGSPVKTVWNTTGGDSFIQGSGFGLEYDPVADRIVGYKGDGHIYALNPETKVWTVHTPSGTQPTAASGDNRTWSRFRYVPSVNAYVCVMNEWDAVYFYKMPTNSGSGNERGDAAISVVGSLEASPNPVQSHLTLRWKGINTDRGIDIYNPRGILVYRSGRLKGTNVEWPVSRIPAGVYMARAWSDNKIVVKRVMVER